MTANKKYADNVRSPNPKEPGRAALHPRPRGSRLAASRPRKTDAETLHGNDTEHFFCKELDVSPQRRRRSRSMRTDEARTRSAARHSLGVRCVRTRHARPHPHPAHRTRMAFTTLSLSSTRASHTQRQRARGTSSPYHHFVAFSVEREDTCRANPSCVLLPCRPDNPCPPSADGVVSAVPARRRSSRSRVCLHAVEEPPLVGPVSSAHVP